MRSARPGDAGSAQVAENCADLLHGPVDLVRFDDQWGGEDPAVPAR